MHTIVEFAIETFETLDKPANISYNPCFVIPVVDVEIDGNKYYLDESFISSIKESGSIDTAVIKQYSDKLKADHYNPKKMLELLSAEFKDS